MKKILIRTSIVLVSVVAVFFIVSASNASSENKKAKTEVTEGCSGAEKAGCCSTAEKQAGCDPSKCDDSKCDPAKCTGHASGEPCCKESAEKCGGEKSAAASTAATEKGCSKSCGGH